MIKPWIFEFFMKPRGPNEVTPAVTAEIFSRHVELWQRAEKLGFEGIFFSEHHFGVGFSPSPNLLIAHVAAVTKTLRLGVMGMVLPFYHPWRVVEEINMLDHLTHGRLEIGTASGIPHELGMLGIDPGEASARNAEVLEFMDVALRQPVITHHGKFWNVDNLPIEPRPFQQPHAPVWVTVMGADSARKAARRGAKISTGFNSTAKIKEVFDAYREEADRAGRKVGPDDVAIRRNITIDENRDAARETARMLLDTYRKMMNAADPRHSSSPDAPKQSNSFTLADDEFIAGTGPDVAEQIIDQCRQTGCGHMLTVFTQVSRQPPLDTYAKALDLYARDVIPVLRGAKI
jgi:alkanesulfonate monooxygenase SsuD/methylene tetrahydromethanopterin reductase-like flavin-dependent oxidoreductase (luciferase family)